MPRIFLESSDSKAAPTRAEADDRLRQYMVAILAAVLAILVRGALNPFLLSDHAFVMSLLAVVAVAWQGGFGPALLTLVLSLAGTIYFFLEPRAVFSVLRQSDQIAAGLFFLCGIVAAQLGEAQRRSRRKAETNLGAAVRKQAALEAEITYRREAEAALHAREAERARSVELLRRSEDRYRSLTEAVPQMVWVADAAGVITYYNQRWIDYTGVTVEQGEAGWMTVAHPDDLPRLAASWRGAVEGRAPKYRHEFRLRRAADGAFRWMLVVGVPFGDDGGGLEWVGTLTDIDDQKLAAEYLERVVRDRTAELSRTNEALRGEVEERGRAEVRERAAGLELLRSNQELEQFAYVASHDLQEPLRKIQAFGDRLRQRCHDQLAEQGRDYIDRMLSSAVAHEAAHRRPAPFLARHHEAPVARPASTSTKSSRASSPTSRSASRRPARAVEVGPLPALEADPVQMRQLFQNLIGNALKFAAPQTPPRVRVSAERADAPPAVGARHVATADEWWRHLLRGQRDRLRREVHRPHLPGVPAAARPRRVRGDRRWARHLPQDRRA